MEGLDKWLTSPPDDGYEDYLFEVTDCFPDGFYEQNEEWLHEWDGEFVKMMWDFFYKQNLTPEQAAEELMRYRNGN